MKRKRTGGKKAFRKGKKRGNASLKNI